MDVGVVGLGLIGGSIALNLSQGSSVIGYDTDPWARARAIELGACEHTSDSLDRFANVKLVFVATPPLDVVPTLIQLERVLRQDAVVTDCAGVKAAIVEEAKSQVAGLFPRFVGGHPMAGKEVGGIDNASANLFEAAPWLLTPTPETSPIALDMLLGFIPTFGAKPHVLSPSDHDQIIATLSHLPHLIAGTMVQMVSKESASFAAGSWRDLTRVAGADPALWTQIVMGNREAILQELRDLSTRLDSVSSSLQAGDEAAIRAFFDSSKTAKRNQV